MDRWKEGFLKEIDIFLWLASSRFFDPNRMLRFEDGLSKGKLRAKADRPMYQNFLDFSQSQKATTPRISFGDISSEAIDFFGKRPLHTTLLRIAEIKSHVKANFTGVLVTKWTGLKGMPVSSTMKEVKERLGGDDLLPAVSGIPLESLPTEDINIVHLTLRAWESTMHRMTAAEIEHMVVRVKEELGAEGKLDYDWKAAKRKKAENKQKRENSSVA